MAKKHNKCELLEFSLKALPIKYPAKGKPTVCLIVANSESSEINIGALVDWLVPIGCTCFMTWGAAADHIHDVLDNKLEDRGGDFLNVTTTSHKGEPAEDVAWFFVNAALPGESELRCCVGYEEGTEIGTTLPIAIRTAVNASL